MKARMGTIVSSPVLRVSSKWLAQPQCQIATCQEKDSLVEVFDFLLKTQIPTKAG